jgi:hypothetical protein
MNNNVENQYLVIRFKNAKLFDNKNSKDKVFNQDANNINRSEIKNFVEPITSHQVSNLIHKLFNERPVPLRRKVFYNKIDYYVKKANNSYITFDNKDYNTDVITLKKAVSDAYSKQTSHYNWLHIKKYLNDDEFFDKFINFISKELSIDTLSVPFSEVVDLIINHKNDKIKNFIKDNCKSKTFYGYFYHLNKNGERDYTTIFNIGETTLTVFRGKPCIVSIYSGRIYIPMSDHDLEVLQNKSSGVSSILDGGLAYIERVIDVQDINTSNKYYTKVSDIKLDLQP